MDAVARRIAGTRRDPAKTIRAVAGITGRPLNISIPIFNIEIAVALVDQYELEGVELVRVLIVISDMVPGDGHHAIGGVEIIRDCAAALGACIDVRPERRDDRIVRTGVDYAWREVTVGRVESDVAVVVDIK